MNLLRLNWNKSIFLYFYDSFLAEILYFYDSFLAETPLNTHQKTIPVPKYSHGIEFH